MDRESVPFNHSMRIRTFLLRASTFVLSALVCNATQAAKPQALEFCGTQFALLKGWEIPEPTRVELENAQFEQLRLAAAQAPIQIAQVSDGAKATLRFEMSQVRKLNSKQIQNLKILDASENLGHGYHAVARGEVDGRSVFVKVSALRDDGKVSAVRLLPGGQESVPRDFTNFKNEVAWAKRLSDLNAGPKFEGVTVLGPRSPHPNHLAVVTEYFPGTHLDHTMANRFGEPGFFPPDFKPTPELFESLNHLKAVIRSEGIASIDLQLRINSRQAVIVDPEFIRPASLQGEVTNLELQIDRIMIALRGLLPR